MYHCRTYLGVLTGLVAAALLAGCGSGEQPRPPIREMSGVKFSGVILLDGKPLTLLKDEEISISFAQADVQGDTQKAAAAEFNATDGTFVINGPSDNGIPPGRWRIGLVSEIYGDGETNRFAAFDSQKGPLVAEVANEPNQFFEVDLTKRTVTKKTKPP